MCRAFLFPLRAFYLSSLFCPKNDLTVVRQKNAVCWTPQVIEDFSSFKVINKILLTTEQPRRRRTMMMMDFRTAVFFLCTTATLLSTTCAIAGFLPFLSLTFPLLRFHIQRTYRVAFFSACLAFIYRIGYTLKKLTGGVTTQEQMRKELNAVTSSNGFQLTMFSMMLAFYSRPIIIALFPICVPALYQWFTIVHKIFHSEDGKSLYTKVGMSRIFSFLQEKMHVALSLSALMEIVILAVIVTDSVRKRSVGKTFMYVMWLRSRYQCEDNTVFRIKYTYYNTGYYHKEAWKSLNQNLFAPLTSRVPALQRVSDGIAMAFTQPRSRGI